MAANGALRVVAMGAKPSGSAVTRSPWLIHTGILVALPPSGAERELSPGAPTPSNSGESATMSISAEPYSRSLAGCTTPPSRCTMHCSP